jgi:hypothetical protein
MVLGDAAIGLIDVLTVLVSILPGAVLSNGPAPQCA